MVADGWWMNMKRERKKLDEITADGRRRLLVPMTSDSNNDHANPPKIPWDARATNG